MYKFKHKVNVIKHKNNKKSKVNPLTVCIAAISEALTPFPKIVFAADRLISAGIQFEHGFPKIDKLCEYCYVMAASNDSLRTDMITKYVRNKVSEKMSIEEILKLFSGECEEMFKKEREKNILGKYGLTYAEFIKKSNTMSPELTKIISTELEMYEYEFKTDFIVLGFDSDFTPHIFVINQFGEYKLHDFLGFASIGSGYDLALPEMTKYIYSPLMPLSTTIVRVYNAKKVAERIAGVGKFTDLIVLHVAKHPDKEERFVAYWEADDKVKKLLDDGIKEMKEKEKETYESITNKLNEFFKKSQHKTEKSEKGKSKK